MPSTRIRSGRPAPAPALKRATPAPSMPAGSPRERLTDEGRPALSDKARRLGLETPEDVEREFRDAKSGWSKGTEYHCPFCEKDFWSASGARKHMRRRGHPVLRWDWY